MRRASVLGLLAAAVVATGSAGAREESPTGLRVLFVGNSLTETNDLPAVVAGMARAAGRTLDYRTIAFGGYALEDHWNQGDARTALSSGRWDVVVMQQGPSALPESQANLRDFATRFSDQARSAGTRPALLTVWPESYRRGALTEVIASYRRAAEAANAELLPAGAAWRAVWRCNPGVALYGRDGFHPSMLGTYTAALTVFGRLFKAPLVVRHLRLRGVSATRARLLQKSAAKALGRRVARACS